MAAYDSNSLEDVTKRLETLEAEVEALKRVSFSMKHDYKLLNSGLTRGSRGMVTMFVLFLIVFVAACVLQATVHKEYLTPRQMLAFAGIQAVTLIAYFVFIFVYTQRIMGGWRKKDGGAEKPASS